MDDRDLGRVSRRALQLLRGWGCALGVPWLCVPWLCVLSIGGLGGCNGDAGAASIDAERIVEAPAGAFASVTSRDRFGLGSFPAPSAPTGASSGASGSLSWSAPEHWVPLAPTAMRSPNFALDVDSETPAECYVTTLGGDGGGLAANLNRWCGQMGRGPLSALEFEQLQRVEICGVQAPYLELNGDFSGMNSATASDSGLLGAVCVLSDRTLFVKLIGPNATVARERESFLAFCRSLQLTPSGGSPGGPQ